MNTHPRPSETPTRALSGATGWIISDGKAGMVVQTKGVADALGIQARNITVQPRGIWRILAPWGPVNPSDRFGHPDAAFAPPWPDIAIATGRAAIPYVRAIKQAAKGKTFTVVLQDPKTGPGTADMIWVPAHDKRRGPNVFTTLTAPHSMSSASLAQRAATPPAEIASLPHPRVALILGGKNAVYKFTEADDIRFECAIASLKDCGASFMITPSRRTHQRLIQAANRATEGAACIFWDGTGENPYPDFLANADLLIVTADSVNMCGEACATGKPVYVFTPSGGSAKFERFHTGLANHGATRPLPEKFDALPAWTYEPLHSADTIAREIEARYKKHQTALP